MLSQAAGWTVLDLNLDGIVFKKRCVACMYGKGVDLLVEHKQVRAADRGPGDTFVYRALANRGGAPKRYAADTPYMLRSPPHKNCHGIGKLRGASSSVVDSWFNNHPEGERKGPESNFFANEWSCAPKWSRRSWRCQTTGMEVTRDLRRRGIDLEELWVKIGGGGSSFV